MKIEALDYRTNKPISIQIKNGQIEHVSEIDKNLTSPYLVAPGLVDLQINGFNGIDFNTLGLTVADIKALSETLYEHGVTTYLPTVITNSDSATETLLNTIATACDSSPEIDACIGGIHLEGPFLSIEDGPRGAHPKEFIKAPDWELFSKWQRAAGGRIRIITLSPEWPEAIDFIKRCVKTGVTVSIGHTAASTTQINESIKAGASMSTHLGNASHSMLPRHSNYIMEQLASDDLWSTLIADGFHLPDSLLKIFIKTKPNKTLLVSDATSYAGLPAGIYNSHIGGDIELDAKGRLFMKNSPSMLAGSAQSLLWCVNQLAKKNILSLKEAWNMASIKPIESLLGTSNNCLEKGHLADLIIFEKEGDTIKIIKTIKSGKLVFTKLNNKNENV